MGWVNPNAGEIAQLLSDALELLTQAHGLALELIDGEIFARERGSDLRLLERLVDAQDQQHLLGLGELLAQTADLRLHLGAKVDERRGPDALGNWTADLPAQPSVAWTREGQFEGPPEWQRELRAKLEHHHGKGATPRAPVYAAGRSRRATGW